jgi:hypothetical protein
MARSALHKQVTGGVYDHEMELRALLVWNLRPQLSLASSSNAI